VRLTTIVPVPIFKVTTLMAFDAPGDPRPLTQKTVYTVPALPEVIILALGAGQRAAAAHALLCPVE
jgi:hypothetical protein